MGKKQNGTFGAVWSYHTPSINLRLNIAGTEENGVLRYFQH